MGSRWDRGASAVAASAARECPSCETPSSPVDQTSQSQKRRNQLNHARFSLQEIEREREREPRRWSGPRARGTGFPRRPLEWSTRGVWWPGRSPRIDRSRRRASARGKGALTISFLFLIWVRGGGDFIERVGLPPRACAPADRGSQRLWGKLPPRSRGRRPSSLLPGGHRPPRISSSCLWPEPGFQRTPIKK